ncbi:Flp family type IVb pilin [Candidatus Riflebacteria bacterium]
MKNQKNCTTFLNWLLNEEGQGLVEYSLIVGLIALVCIAALSNFQAVASNNFTKIDTAMTKSIGNG